MKVWQFEPLDSCFFRGAKSFNQGESGFLTSQFPPTAQTLSGLARATIAETMGVDWQRFHQGKQPDIATLIGKNSDDCGALHFTGPYIIKDKQCLYPVPRHLLYDGNTNQWSRLQPSKKEFISDLGETRLPEPIQQIKGAKPVEAGWLDQEGMQRVLNNQHPRSFYAPQHIFQTEPRTGIGRDNHLRKTVDGQLYFTRHLRLKRGVSLAMGVHGADAISPASMVRIGGEGRLARLDTNHNVDLNIHHRAGNANQAMLILLTHGDFAGASQPNLPSGIEIVSACLGKAVREGGWDYKKHQPKPLKSLVPAGSVYFIKGDIGKLQESIGERTAFGYGAYTIGKWKE